jgi:hypothetical protein
MSALRVQSDSVIVPCFYCDRDCGQDTQLVRNSGGWVPSTPALWARRPLTS